MSEKEIEKIKNSYDLVTNAYTLKLLGKHNFKKCVLIEWNKKDNEIDKYIEILEVFEKNTIQALKDSFNFLSK